MHNNRKPEMGKYLLWQYFRRHPFLRSYLPETRRYSFGALKHFLNRYQALYIKPSAGSRGRDIYKVWQAKRRFWLKETTHPAMAFTSIEKLHLHLQKTALRRERYIIQQAIDLAEYLGSPFDIRSMAQKAKPGGRWLFSGMLAKVAGKHSVVTNVARSHGYVITVDAALRHSFHWDSQKIANVKKEMIQITLLAAKHLDNYQTYRELGLDIALDSSGRIWIIEENTGPSHALFARLHSDLSMYRLIQRRSRAYRLAKKSRLK